FQAEDGIRDFHVTGVQTCALPILRPVNARATRTHVITASVPELLKRTLSNVGIASFSIFANLISCSVGVPNNTPVSAACAMAFRSEERRVGKEGMTGWEPGASSMR